MSDDFSVIREVASKVLDWPGRTPFHTPEETEFLSGLAKTETYPKEEQRVRFVDLVKKYEDALEELYVTMNVELFAEEIADGRLDSAEETAGAVLTDPPPEHP